MCFKKYSEKLTLWKMHYSFRGISSCFFDKRSRAHEKTEKSIIAPNMFVELQNIFSEVIQKVFLNNTSNK